MHYYHSILFFLESNYFVSREEFRAVVAQMMIDYDKLSESEVDSIFEIVDINRDGAISFAEFKGFYEQIYRVVSSSGSNSQGRSIERRRSANPSLFDVDALARNITALATDGGEISELDC